MATTTDDEFDVNYQKSTVQPVVANINGGIPLSPDQTSRLTNWANEPTLANLKQDFQSAKPAHDTQVTKIKHWENVLLVRNEAKPKKVTGKSSVQPKLARRQAEWRYPALSEPLLSSHKLFKVSPITFEDKDCARQNELILNHQFRTQMNRVQFIDNYVRTVVDEGTAIIRVGWDRSTKMEEKEVPEYRFVTIQDQQQLEQLQMAIQMKTENPRMYNEQISPELQAAVDFYEESQQPAVAQLIGHRVVTSEVVVTNKPTVEIMNYENVFIDTSSNGDIDKASFVIISFETSRAELKKNPERYKNLDRIDFESNNPLSFPDHTTNTPDMQVHDTARKKVVAYEYWGFYDINGDDVLVPIVVTWIGNTIIRMELNPYPDQKLPFVVVPYLPVKKDVYGEPDAELLEDNQHILGAITRGMIDVMGRSANGQQGFAKGMLDPLNKRRFESGQDYEFNPNLSPVNGHINHTYPEIPSSAMNMLALQNQEAEALTGVKSFSGGLSGDSYGDVVAGIKGALDAASKREMSILRRIAKGLKEIGQKIATMNSVFLSREETVRITNDEFITINREDLKGNYDIEVEISTAEVDNMQAQDLGFMLQTIGPNMDPGIMKEILAEIADLKRMPALAEQIRRYEPTPDPLEEELKKLAIAKAQLEVAELQALIELKKAETRLKQAEADQKALDTVDQESGKKHLRDLEKQRAQAEGNQNLQITKALTTPRKIDEFDPDIEAAIGFNEMSNGSRNISDSSTNIPTPLVPPSPMVSDQLIDPTQVGGY